MILWISNGITCTQSLDLISFLFFIFSDFYISGGNECPGAYGYAIPKFIASPGYPLYYNDPNDSGIYCSWVITNLVEKPIGLKFIDLNINVYDSLLIREGVNKTGKLLFQVRSGSVHSYIPSAKSLYVTFSAISGFRIRFKLLFVTSGK